MSVSLVFAVLAAWVIVGAGVAFAFGSLGRVSDAEDDADELTPKTVEHLRPHRRTSASGACSVPGEKLQHRAMGR